MVIFSSLQAAQDQGFLWFEFRTELDMHLVVRHDVDLWGRRVRRLALARADRFAGSRRALPFSS